MSICKRAYVDYLIKIEKGIILKTVKFHQSYIFKLMLLEFVLNIIHCPPRVDIAFDVDNIQKSI